MLPSTFRIRRRRTAGFSLIELLVVVLIIGVLIGVGLPAFLRQRQTTQDRAVQADLTTAGKLISAFYLAHGESFTNIEFENGEEPGVPTNVVPDWPTHQGRDITITREGDEIACLSTKTAYGAEWTLVVVADHNDADAKIGQWFGRGPAATWCDNSGGGTVASHIDADGDGVADLDPATTDNLLTTPGAATASGGADDASGDNDTPDPANVIATITTDLCNIRSPWRVATDGCGGLEPSPHGGAAQQIVAEAVLDAVPDADLSMIGGPFVRSSLYAGDFTYENATNFMPFNNTIYTVEVSGQDIVDTISAAAAAANYGDPEYPFGANIHWTIPPDVTQWLTNPEISGVEVWDGAGWVAIDPFATYTVATTSFYADGANGAWPAFGNAPSTDTGVLDRDALVDYFQNTLSGVVNGPAHYSTQVAESGDDDPVEGAFPLTNLRFNYCHLTNGAFMFSMVWDSMAAGWDDNAATYQLYYALDDSIADPDDPTLTPFGAVYSGSQLSVDWEISVDYSPEWGDDPFPVGTVTYLVADNGAGTRLLSAPLPCNN